MVLNTYRLPPNLYINGEAITSSEGTTQGDPLAMSIYAIATLPLIMELDNLSKQLWFADDAAAAGRLQAVKQWWDRLAERGPKYGYSVNPSKTWLVVKGMSSQLCQRTLQGHWCSGHNQGKSISGILHWPR